MKCSAEVADHTGFNFGPCSRRGVLMEDGKPWCRQHAPSAVAARRKAAQDRHTSRWAKDAEDIARRKACALACDGVDDPQPGELLKLRREVGLLRRGEPF